MFAKRKGIVTGAPAQRIVPGAAIEPVVAIATEEPVGPGPTRQAVIACAARNRHILVRGCQVNRIVSACKIDFFHVAEITGRIATGLGITGISEVRRRDGDIATGYKRNLIMAIATVNRVSARHRSQVEVVVAIPTIDRIIALLTLDPVIAGPTLDIVVPKSTIDRVCPVTPKEAVVIIATGNSVVPCSAVKRVVACTT